MRIAFDAKRAYQNTTGLGNYSRVLLDRLAMDYPEHEYFAMAPKRTSLYTPPKNIQTVTPQGLDKIFKSGWRSSGVKKDLQRLNIDLYHGLSHEIPIGIQDINIKSVVTIHDLVFEHYPAHFKPVDVMIYRKKFRYACAHADKVIAVSEQTKKDIIELYGIPADKIDVCYMAANEQFEQQHSAEEKERVRKKYHLPEQYFLTVGSVIERKNLLNVCKALQQLKGTLDIPLVVIGSMDGGYAGKVRAYVREQNLEQDIIFMVDRTETSDEDFTSSKDLPAIYQSATAMIYPSVYEGFGIPVLEALWSRTPVITSNISCLPEAGGDAAYYVDPMSVDEIANAMQQVADDETLRASMKEKGLVHAGTLTTKAFAERTMGVYMKLF